MAGAAFLAFPAQRLRRFAVFTPQLQRLAGVGGRDLAERGRKAFPDYAPSSANFRHGIISANSVCCAFQSGALTSSAGPF